MKKWPFFAIILPWMASCGSKRSVQVIFSARDDLVKVSWKSDAWKCQNQLTSLYFYQQSERSQPLCGTLIIDRSTNWKIVVTRQRVWIQTRTQSFYEVGVNFCLGLLGLRQWSKVLFLTMSHSCPRRRWWQERGRRHSQHRSSDGIEALWKLKENSDAEYER